MKKILLSISLLCAATNAWGGGYLTNTNQSVAFLRNPAQDAAVNLNSVYSNPAGVNFLDNGLHVSINLQSAYQSRDVKSSFLSFANGLHNNGKFSKEFKSTAKAPVIPSIQAAYVRGRLSYQLNLALIGGGGKAEFKNGMGSFESQVALLGITGQELGKIDPNWVFNKYDVKAYMHGRQYFMGATLGAGYKINERFSAYVGLRGVYATAHYDGYLKDIRINPGNKAEMVDAAPYFQNLYGDKRSEQSVSEAAAEAKQKLAAEANKAGNTAEYEQHLKAAEEWRMKAAGAAQLAHAFGALAAMTQDLTLSTNQHAFGIAPIIGVHYQTEKISAAAKYEFGTKINFKNKATNSPNANNLALLAPYRDGMEVRSDIPALLTLGVQYRPTKSLRLNAGYHYYFDKQAKSGVSGQWHNELLSGGTQEVLLGAEYDINKKWEVSAGLQRTFYPNTQEYMRDLTFNVDSYSLGLGVGYHLNDRIKINAGYFHSFYENYLKDTRDYNGVSRILAAVKNEEFAHDLVAVGRLRGADLFTRRNNVFGLGVELKF